MKTLSVVVGCLLVTGLSHAKPPQNPPWLGEEMVWVAPKRELAEADQVLPWSSVVESREEKRPERRRKRKARSKEKRAVTDSAAEIRKALEENPPDFMTATTLIAKLSGVTKAEWSVVRMILGYAGNEQAAQEAWGRVCISTSEVPELRRAMTRAREYLVVTHEVTVPPCEKTPVKQ